MTAYRKLVDAADKTNSASLTNTHILFMDKFSKEVGTRPIYIDGEQQMDRTNIDKLLLVNEEEYQRVANEYIKENFNGKIEGKSYKQQIISFLEGI